MKLSTQILPISKQNKCQFLLCLNYLNLLIFGNILFFISCKKVPNFWLMVIKCPSVGRQVPCTSPALEAGVRGTIKRIFPLLTSCSPLRARKAPACGRRASQIIGRNLIKREGRDSHSVCLGEFRSTSLVSKVFENTFRVPNPQPLMPVSHAPKYFPWWSRPVHEPRDPPCRRKELDHG